MNFISHFFFDRDLDDSIFVVGACSPDLLSVFDRKAKLVEKEVHARAQAQPMTEAQKSFYLGVIRHFQLDKHFHSSQFFHEETSLLAKSLREHFSDQGMKRSFFVAHVLLELLLDKLLLEQDEVLLRKFYEHLQKRSVPELVTLSEWMAGKSLPRYDAFLNRFVNEEHLFRYKELSYISLVLKRILERVNIYTYPYLEQNSFIPFLEQYQESLSSRHPMVLEKLNQSLYRVSEG